MRKLSRRHSVLFIVGVLVLGAGTAAARAAQRSSRESTAAHTAVARYHIDLGPKRAPVDDSVMSAFDAAGRRVRMRVCSDPNNLPFSNAHGDGFENKLAAVLASDLHLQLSYSWWPQRRGFVRNTLNLGNCDVIMGIASASDLVMATEPYYRSTYMFVTRRDRHLRIRSFDDPRLRHLSIGIHVIGGDDANPPPAQALAERKLGAQIVGFPIYGSYDDADPPARLLDAVAARKVDVAVVWGPLAGYYALHHPRPALDLEPVSPKIELPFLPFVFDVAVGVRHGDTTWRDQLQGALDRHHDEIGRLLADYGVPLERVTVSTRR